MENKKLEKNLIFFSPGNRGALFTHKAGNLINDTIIHETMEILTSEMEAEGRIECVEERRLLPRLV
ncbi:MAG: hypothetical protein GY874_15495 [Desulfobacteraceae bacterium]|nr:hypothetical protein [Desulfobacteraceae bacterium]